MELLNPACPAGCATCTLTCAILPKRLKYWKDEVQRLELAGPEQTGEASWLELVSSAQAIVESLQAQLAGSPWDMAAALSVLVGA